VTNVERAKKCMLDAERARCEGFQVKAQLLMAEAQVWATLAVAEKEAWPTLGAGGAGGVDGRDLR
jgi:hypothetical protein